MSQWPFKKIFSTCFIVPLTYNTVALSGAHTIGHAHDRKVSKACEDLIPGSTERAQNLDDTPFLFDNSYWKGLTRATCPKRKIRAYKYDSCTRPYLTSDWTDKQARARAVHLLLHNTPSADVCNSPHLQLVYLSVFFKPLNHQCLTVS